MPTERKESNFILVSVSGTFGVGRESVYEMPFLKPERQETRRLFKGVTSQLIRSVDLFGDIMTFCKIDREKIKNKLLLPDSEKAEIIRMVSHEAKGRYLLTKALVYFGLWQAVDMFLYARLVIKNLLGQT